MMKINAVFSQWNPRLKGSFTRDSLKNKMVGCLLMLTMVVGGLGVLSLQAQGAEKDLKLNSRFIHPFDFLEMVAVGKPAPNFTAKAANGKTVDLSMFRNKKNVVMVFYQGHFCGVCAQQLQNIQAYYDEFKKTQTEIVAVSADDPKLAQMTLGEQGLSFYVIPDPDKAIIHKYGVENVSKGGIAYPSAYLIDKKGVVKFSFADRQSTRIHSPQLLDAIRRLSAS